MDRALAWVLLLYPRQMRRRYGLEIAELTRDLIRLEDRSPARLQLQLHKFIWSPTTRGV